MDAASKVLHALIATIFGQKQLSNWVIRVQGLEFTAAISFCARSCVCICALPARGQLANNVYNREQIQ